MEIESEVVNKNIPNDELMKDLPSDPSLLAESVFSAFSDSISPALKIPLSQWVAENIVLPQEASSLPGKWDPTFAPYQAEILDALGDPDSRKVVWRASSQVGKSLVLILFLLGIIKYMPAPTMLAMDTMQNAGDFYKNRVGGIVQANPEILDLVSSAVAKNARNKISKNFPGGRIHVAGATNASSLSSHPVKYAVGDEIGRWKRSASKEGDPVQLLDARLETYRGSELMYLCSTPTVLGFCKITEDFDLGTQEFWNFKCIDCEEHFKPTWDLVTYNDDLSEVGIFCPHCGSVHDDQRRVQAAQAGKFVAENPEGHYRSFHTDSLSSPFAKLKENIQKYLDAQGDLELEKVFTNTKLGLPFDEEAFGRETVSDIPFMEHSQDYDLTRVPASVTFVTATSDTQKDRVETLVLGWVNKTKAYYLDRTIHYGPTADSDQVWEDASEYVNNFAVTREDGIALRPSVWFCDSGGHSSKEVYKWSGINRRPPMYAVKGSSKFDYPVVNDKAKPVGSDRRGLLLITGPNACKFTVYQMLAGVANKDSIYKFYVPHNLEIPEDFFKQITSERIIQDKMGNRLFEKPHSSVRNEQLDMAGYAVAAVHFFDPDFSEINRRLIANKSRRELEPQIQSARDKDKALVPESTSDGQDREEKIRKKHKLPTRRPRRGSWVTNF